MWNERDQQVLVSSLEVVSGKVLGEGGDDIECVEEGERVDNTVPESSNVLVGSLAISIRKESDLSPLCCIASDGDKVFGLLSFVSFPFNIPLSRSGSSSKST